MNPSTFDRSPPNQNIKLTRFDSLNFQNPELKTKNSREPYDFPEIQLYEEPSFTMSIEGENPFTLQDFDLQKKDSNIFNMNNQQDMLDLQLSVNKFSFEYLERKASQSCREFSRFEQENATEIKAKKTKYAALAEYHTADADLSLPSLNKSIKKTKLIKKKKRIRRRRKSKKFQKMKEVLLTKTCSKIFSTFAMQFEDMFSLYPSLRSAHQTTTFSTFPKVFSASNDFCQTNNKNKSQNRDQNLIFKSKTTKNNSSDSESTRLSDDEPQFTDVKSTLVRSKVDNLKGSMLCFEMNQNLKEMLEVSKCMKWQRRREYRTQMAEKGVDEFPQIEYGESMINQTFTVSDSRQIRRKSQNSLFQANNLRGFKKRLQYSIYAQLQKKLGIYY